MINYIKNLFKKTLLIKKHNPNLPDLKILDKGDWIDLYFSDIISLVGKSNPTFTIDSYGNEYTTVKKGDILKASFGIGVKLPKGYEAYILPRSSTFKSTGLTQPSSIGIIDNSYSGDNDVWFGVFECERDSTITRYDRIAQFRIQKKMRKPLIKYVNKLDTIDRGGHGSSGK